MIDRLLKSHLEPLARSGQRWRLWRGLALGWAAIGLAGCAAILLDHFAVWSSPLTFFALGIAAVVSAVVVVRRFRARPLDYQALAREIERENPELHALLLTAVEQQPLSPSGELNYLQQRVVLEALVQHRRSAWGRRIARRYSAARGAQWAALAFLFAVLFALHPHFSFSNPGALWSGFGRSNAVTVTPGDASIERGGALVVLARFEGRLPAEAQLVIAPVNDNEQSIPLTKNLEDPVFGGGIPQVRDDLKYHVEYSTGRTRDFKISVFDYPRLNHADATIDYPAYTGLPEKTIKDTRRVSAVEGSSLAYSFYLNKPVVTARLVPKDAPAIPLTADATNAAVYHAQFILDQSRRYALVLVDDAGRTNKMPPEFVLDALPNRAAEVKIDSPRGDQRVSSLEEIHFSAEATGEFGLHAYGIAYTLGDGETRTVELGQGGKAGEKRQFNYLLPLESLGAQPDELLSYYVWADDTGPDGQTRHNASDIFFAEIKPFDEIFREAQTPSGDQNQGGQNGGQNGQGEGQAEQLADQEKDILTATWNLKRRETAAKPSDKYKDDVRVVRDAQQQALDQVHNDDPRSQSLIDAVMNEMKTAAGRLGEAADKNSLKPLPAALSAEQSAYQGVLKLLAREYQVARAGRNQGRTGQRAGDRAQAQLDELDLQQNADRYQTEQQASSPRPDTQQQREQLQVASRLKDLARRQQDLNARLRELQAELQEARTPQQRADLQEQLKRLTEEQQDMLADVDELRQRLDNSANQPQNAQDRQQLEQTRSEVQSAAESLAQNAVSQAVASGTRAQNELQQLQDDYRKRNSGQFTDEMRRMRDDARQLSQNQQDLEKKINDLAENQKLAETDEQRRQRDELASQLSQQKNGVTNLVDEMRQVSEQSETAEPLLSEQLYDTLRQTGLDQLDNSLDTTSEYVRRGFLRQAGPAAEPARTNIDELKNGVDHAAESILGDGTEALRLAQRELQQLSQQLEPGLAGDTNAPATNGMAGGPRGQGEEQLAANQRAGAQDNQGGGDQNGARGNNGQRGQGQGQGQGQPDQATDGQAGNGGNPPGSDTDVRARLMRRRAQENGNTNSADGGQAGTGGERQGNQPGGRGGNGQGEARAGQPAAGNEGGNGGTNDTGIADGGERAGGERNGARDNRSGGAHGAGGLNRGVGNYYGPLVGNDYVQWTDGLRDVEEMIDLPEVSSEIARIRDQARALHFQYKNGQRPDWAVITTQISAPLAEVRARVDEELLKRQSKDALVPLDRDPVPPKYSDQVRRYYEQLGKSD